MAEDVTVGVEAFLPGQMQARPGCQYLSLTSPCLCLFFFFSTSVASSCFSVFHFLKGRSGNRISMPGFSLSSDLAVLGAWLLVLALRAWQLFRCHLFVLLSARLLQLCSLLVLGWPLSCQS